MGEFWANGSFDSYFFQPSYWALKIQCFIPTQSFKAAKPCFHGISPNNWQNLHETCCCVLCPTQLMKAPTVHQAEPNAGVFELSRTATDHISEVRVLHCNWPNLISFQVNTIKGSEAQDPAGLRRSAVMPRNITQICDIVSSLIFQSTVNRFCAVQLTIVITWKKLNWICCSGALTFWTSVGRSVRNFERSSFRFSFVNNWRLGSVLVGGTVCGRQSSERWLIIKSPRNHGFVALNLRACWVIEILTGLKS